MDRPMRRKDRLVTDQEKIDSFLRSCRTLILGFSGSEAPYLLPINYGYLPGPPGEFYFHGAASGKKIDLMGPGVQVGFTVFREGELITGPQACDWGMNFMSVIGQGWLACLDTPEEKRRGLDILMSHFGSPGPHSYEEGHFSHTRVFRLRITEISAKEKI